MEHIEMSRNAKMTKAVTWEKHMVKEQESLSSLLISAAWESIAMLSLVFASISMLSVIAQEIHLDAWGLFMLVLLSMVLPFYFRVGRYLITLRFGEKRQRAIWRLATYLPMLVVLLLLWRKFAGQADSIQGGASAICTFYFKYFNRIYGTTYAFTGQEEFISYALCFGSAALLCILYFLSLLWNKRLTILGFPMISIALLMNVGLAPRWGQILFVILGAFMLFRQRSGNKWAKGAMLATAMLGGALLLSGVIFAGMSGKLLEHSKAAKQFEGSFEKEVKSLFNGAFFQKNGDVNNDRPTYNDAKVMTVRIWEEPSTNLYFKDYYATDYTARGWIVSEDEFRRQCKEHGVGTEKAAGYLAQALYRSGAYQTMLYQLKYQGAFRKKYLLPYGTDYESIKDLAYQGDYLTLKRGTEKTIAFEGIREYGYRRDALLSSENVASGSDEEEELFWEWYDAYAKDKYRDTPSEIYETDVYETINAVMAHGYYTISSLGMQTGKDNSSGNQQRLKLALLVSGYLRGERLYDLVYGNTMQSGYTYDLELDSLPAGEDPVLYFLEKSKMGYCVHFASAGVLILRAFGVPARYASGYVVKPSAFVKQEDGSYEAEVVDRNAHAWAEIYLDGLGWIPIEMTAGYDSATKVLPTSVQAQQERKNNKSEEEKARESSSQEEESKESESSQASEQGAEESHAIETSEEENASEDDTEKDGQAPHGGTVNDTGANGEGHGEDSEEKAGPGAGSKIVRVMLYVTLMFAVIGALILIALACYARYQKKLADIIKKKYYRPAVLLMNRRIYKKLRLQHFGARNITSDRAYGEALQAYLGDGAAPQIGEFLRIVEEAAFSYNKITKDECRTVYQIYRKIRQRKSS